MKKEKRVKTFRVTFQKIYSCEGEVQATDENEAIEAAKTTSWKEADLNKEYMDSNYYQAEELK